MLIRDLATGTEHERVVECIEEESGYHSIIAIHSTKLGPGVGGTRLWSYDSVEAAVQDALRLSGGMTLKCAAAGLPFGGGKAVILAPATAGPLDRESLFRAHGRAIDQLGGSYITGEDVGTSPSDMQMVLRETRYVAGLPGRTGDPSPSTARGVFRAIQAAVFHRWGDDALAGRTVAVQGCGNVGRHLARELQAVGAALVVSDVDDARAARTAAELGARVVAPEKIYDVEADVFAPCALGGILNDGTLSRLWVAVIAGAANNQLADERHAAEFAARGIVYVPDFIANAGGVINGCREVTGWDRQWSTTHIEAIYDAVLAVLRAADREGITTAEAARRVAQARLEGRWAGGTQLVPPPPRSSPSSPAD